MKKIIFLFTVILITSCSFKDKEGNAPLIRDKNGYLVDNPEYKSDAYYKASEIVDSAKEANKNEVKKLQKNMKQFVDSLQKAEKNKK